MTYLGIPEELGLLMWFLWSWQFPVSQAFCACWSLNGTFRVQLISASHAWTSCKSVRVEEILLYL